jgi:hypothetical protein
VVSLAEAVWVEVSDLVLVVLPRVVVTMPEVTVLTTLLLPVEEAPPLEDLVLVETGTEMVEPSEVRVLRKVVACGVY